MVIKVLGSGCLNCKKLHQSAEEAIKELKANINLEYITDMERIIAYGVMSTPALVINERVVSQGRILSKEDIIKLIKSNEVLEPTKGKCNCGGNC